MGRAEPRRIWNTPFTRAFRCRLPVLSAPMADVSGGALAAEVTRAGGLGFVAAGHFRDPAGLEAEIATFEDRVAGFRAPSSSSSEDAGGGSQRGRGPERGSDLAIGFIGHSSLATPGGWEAYERVLARHRPKAVQFFAPAVVSREDGTTSNVTLAHDHGAKFVAQVGSVREAAEALRHGVDAIVCQGSEAGGHGLRRDVGNATGPLASHVSGLSGGVVPVLAAGGIVTGRHLASMLCVCDGVAMGTRYWACRESLGDERLQRELTRDNSCDDVVRTTAFDAMQNATSSTPWPRPYDSSGVLRNRTTEAWDGTSEEELRRAIDETGLTEEYEASREASDATAVPVYAGQGVGEIESIEGAYDITLKVEQEAIDTIERLRSI